MRVLVLVDDIDKSPDAQNCAFIAGGRLYKIDLAAANEKLLREAEQARQEARDALKAKYDEELARVENDFSENVAQFIEAVESTARKTKPSKATPAKRYMRPLQPIAAPSGPGKADREACRRWAQANGKTSKGKPVGDRGRLPEAIVAEWLALPPAERVAKPAPSAVTVKAPGKARTGKQGTTPKTTVKAPRRAVGASADSGAPTLQFSGTAV